MSETKIRIAYFKVQTGKPSKNHIKFKESIDDKMFNIRKFNEYLKDKIKVGLGYKNIALKSITISPDCDYPLKRMIVLFISLKCVNNNTGILSEFSALLDQ